MIFADLVNLFEANGAPFLLVFFRMTGLMIFTPFYGSQIIPTQIKALFAFVVTLLIFSSVDRSTAPAVETMGQATVFILGETAVGLLIGLVGTIVFAAFQLAGQIVGYQMGFALANVYDPQSNDQVSILSNFYFIFATLVFLLINGHHVFLDATLDSFARIPLGGVFFAPEALEHFKFLMVDMFRLGLQVAAPCLATLFITEVCLGFLARTVPQMNILIIGFPIRVGLGLIMIGISLEIAGEFLPPYLRYPESYIGEHVGWCIRNLMPR